MGLNLERIFNALSPVRSDSGQLAYSVGRVPRFPSYLVGRDTSDKACILIAAVDPHEQRHAPIRLENLEVAFDVRSRITEPSRSAEGTFTVVRCLSDHPEIIRYFFRVAETILRVLGTTPTRAGVAEAIAHLARIFQRLLAPPLRPVTGLFGELFLIKQCRNPVKAISGWRLQDSSRFDFTASDLRLDVKTTSARARIHTFSYEQCNPPAGTAAFVASLFAEQTATGISLKELLDQIEPLISGRPELAVKLHETVSSTLGSSLKEAIDVRFDEKLAASSLCFFDLRAIPAIRQALPAGVSNLHFRSDLSGLRESSFQTLIDQEPAIEDFLP
jgi:hypothetical protein